MLVKFFMENKPVYKLGDWLLHRASGDIYEITFIWPDAYNPIYRCVQKFDGLNQCLYTNHYSSTKDYNNLQEFFELANAARVLYSKEGR